MMKIGGWVLIVLGILGTELQLLLFFAPFAWAITVAVLIMAFVRYRTGERRALIACLAAAAEHQIPLEQAARAFAKERSDDMGMHRPVGAVARKRRTAGKCSESNVDVFALRCPLGRATGQ